ncbi:hypothetical protein ACFTSD_05835 [Nocardiaceae bacterium NPDC056970]
MPLTGEHTRRYADALVALAAATHRPANIVNLGETYAIRVEFELGRHLLATNDGGDLSTGGGDGSWTVRLCGRSGEVLAEADGEWLVDAFDAVIATLRSSDWWTDGGTLFGEFTPSNS